MIAVALYIIGLLSSILCALMLVASARVAELIYKVLCIGLTVVFGLIAAYLFWEALSL